MAKPRLGIVCVFGVLPDLIVRETLVLWSSFFLTLINN